MTDSNLNDTRTDIALDVAAPLVATVPLIGGAASNIVGQITTKRRLQRVVDFIEAMSNQLTYLQNHVSEASKEYVKTEDFEELLLETLERVSKEPDDERRKLYGLFLTGSIASPHQPYNEQLRLLKTLEDIQPAHLIVLRAYMQDPDPNGSSRSMRQTLQKRIGDQLQSSSASIGDLVDQLYRLDLLSQGSDSLGVGMTTTGAENLASRLTPFGSRFMAFLLAGTSQ